MTFNLYVYIYTIKILSKQIIKMNKFNSSKCFGNGVMRSRMSTAPKTMEIEELAVHVKTPQEIKEDSDYKDEQEITHETDPEKEKYLPGEKLLKKINKANKKKKKVRIQEPNDEPTLTNVDIDRLVMMLKKNRLV